MPDSDRIAAMPEWLQWGYIILCFGVSLVLLVFICKMTWGNWK